MPASDSMEANTVVAPTASRFILLVRAILIFRELASFSSKRKISSALISQLDSFRLPGSMSC